MLNQTEFVDLPVCCLVTYNPVRCKFWVAIYLQADYKKRRIQELARQWIDKKFFILPEL